MAKHAFLSASSAHRWLECPPSAKACEGVDERASPYAQQGTDCHELCAYLVEKALGRDAEDPTENLDYYDQEMQDCAEGYCSYVMEQVEDAKKHCPDPQVMVEQRLDFSRWVEDGFGTGDCVIVADDVLQIIDYKHGLGVLVSAEKNPQMMCYALGAVELFDGIYDIKEIRMTIYQPRRENISTYSMTKEELLTWAEEVLVPTAKLAYEGKGEFKAGEHCQFCKVKKMNIYRRTVKLVNGVGHYTTYVCGRATKNNLNDPPKNVKADDLDALVLKLIQQHIAVYVDARDRLKKLNRATTASGKKEELQKKLADQEARREKIKGFIKNLYEDFADGVFTEDDYLEMKEGYLAEQDAIVAEIGEIQRAIDLYAADYAGDEVMADAFTKYIGVDCISRELVTTFIKKITCYSKTRFEVEFTFGDELQELLNLVEQRGADVG